jgi:hypothetical protein
VNFEGLSDGSSVGNQYPGLIFSNATVVTSGISLNELEFPPHSGVSAVMDDGGPISVVFSTPLLGVGAYLTYTVPITLSAFSLNGGLLGTVSSKFSNNDALYGVAGSSPDELLLMSNASGISEVVFGGSSGGGSFVLDDLTTASLTNVSVPEPDTFVPFACALLFIIHRARSRPPRKERHV